MKHRSIANNATVPRLTKLSDAGLLAIVFTILAFQDIRFEGYETEKIGLIGILVAIILAINLGGVGLQRFISQTTQSENGFSWRSIRSNPLILAVLGLLTVELFSTLFSLSFTRSLWGSPDRAQGLIIAACYGVIFWQALRSGEHFRAALVPSFIIIAIPLCLWTILTAASGPSIYWRPGSTAGQANFMSSWLLISFLYCAPQIYWQASRWEQPWSRRRIWFIALCGMVTVLRVIALLQAGSRGTLLGLGAAAITAITALAALKSKPRWLFALAAAALLLVAGYLLVRRVANPTGDVQGMLRLLRPFDETRVALWNAASMVVAGQVQPLAPVGQVADRWKFLRPLIGYGLDTIDQTDISKLALITNTYPDRFHNLVFDTFVMLGGLGLAATLLIYGSAAYLALRWLQLIEGGEWRLWIAFEFIGICIGALVGLLLTSQGPRLAFVPLAAALGAVAGCLSWIARKAVLQRFAGQHSPTLTLRHVLVLSLLCIVVEQWVDNQFGFIQAATQPLWWIMLGLLVLLTGPASAPTTDPLPLEQTPSCSGLNAWQTAAMVAGLFLLHGMGVAIQSSLVSSEVGSLALPALLGIIWLAGWLGATLSGSVERPAAFRQGFVIVGVWLAFFILKTVLRILAGTWLDSAVGSSSIAIVSLQRPFIVLSIGGIVLSILAFFAWAGIYRLKRLSILHLVVLAAFVFAAGVSYSLQYASATLHAVGNGLRASNQPGLFVLSDIAFQAASDYMPTDARLRLHWISTLAAAANSATSTEERTAILAIIDEQKALIRFWEPFFVNTREWHLSEQALAPAASTP